LEQFLIDWEIQTKHTKTPLYIIFITLKWIKNIKNVKIKMAFCW
jgi:hypothetical protein